MEPTRKRASSETSRRTACKLKKQNSSKSSPTLNSSPPNGRWTDKEHLHKVEREMGSNTNGDVGRSGELDNNHLDSSWSDGECSSMEGSNPAVDSEIFREDQLSVPKTNVSMTDKEQLSHKTNHKPSKLLIEVLSACGHQKTSIEDSYICEESRNPNFTTEMEAQKEKTHTCICGKSYTSTSHLYRHQRTHIGENQLIGGHSDGVIWEEKTTKKKSFSCICGKCYTISSHLYRHQKTCKRMLDDRRDGCIRYLGAEQQGRKLKPYLCACGKSYTSSSHLYRHQRSHLEAKTESEKRYICDCGKSYGSSSHLYRHQRGHTEETFLVEELGDDSMEDTEI